MDPLIDRGARRSPELGVISHLLPPGESGYAMMLNELLRDIPADKIALVGSSNQRWGDRATVRIPDRFRSQAFSAALLSASGKRLIGRALAKAFPNVRRVLTMLDPSMILGAEWARAARAELWLYGIDLHARTFWHRARFLEPSFQRGVEDALAAADACFGLSQRMAEWMEAKGARGRVEVLPPLIDVAPAKPLPEGPARFVYCGWIYSSNAAPLKWIERAAESMSPRPSLRLVTRSSRSAIQGFGLDPARWSIASADTTAQVAAEVAQATWTVVGLAPDYPDREVLRVAWPTKLREYLAVGRPVLCIAGDDFAAAEIARQGGWGLVASSEAATRAAVQQAATEPRDVLVRRARAAHAFALEWLDNATVGARWRARALA